MNSDHIWALIVIGAFLCFMLLVAGAITLEQYLQTLSAREAAECAAGAR